MTNDKIALALAEIAEMGRAWQNARTEKPSLANKLASVIADRCRDVSEMAKRHGVQLISYPGAYVEKVMLDVAAQRVAEAGNVKRSAGTPIRTFTSYIEKPAPQQPAVEIDFGDEFGILPG